MSIAATALIAALLAQAEPPTTGQTQPPVQLPQAVQLPPVEPRLGIEPASALDLWDPYHDFRLDAAAHGFTYNANLTIDGGYNFTGGAKAGGFLAGLLTAAVQVETMPLMGWEGGMFLARWQSYFESNPGPYQLVPDYWGYESLASGIGDVNQLSECYYQQSLWGDRAKICFGKQDACNTFMNPLGASAYFISPGDTYTASIVPFMPTYPDQAMGLVATGKPVESVELKFGWFDGTSAYSTNGAPPRSPGSLGPGTFFDNPGSWFYIAEADIDWSLSEGLDGVLGLGGWWQTGPSVAAGVNVPTPMMVSDYNAGWYAQVRQRLFNLDPATDSIRGVQFFAQFGWGDPTVNPVQWSLASGVVYNGPFPGRESDSVGVMMQWASFSDTAAVYNPTGGLYECSAEVYYNIAITDWMSLQPDLQVLVSPMGNSEMPTAVIGILRLSINF